VVTWLLSVLLAGVVREVEGVRTGQLPSSLPFVVDDSGGGGGDGCEVGVVVVREGDVVVIVILLVVVVVRRRRQSRWLGRAGGYVPCFPSPPFSPRSRSVVFDEGDGDGRRQRWAATAMWGWWLTVEGRGRNLGGKRLRLWLAVDASSGRCFVRLAELKRNGRLA